MKKTDKQITLDNLTKIYKELPELAKTKPSIISDFNMRFYGVYDCLKKDEISNHQCNTHGCGLGNSAFLFKLSKDDFDSDGEFSYDKFGERILPFCYNEYDRKTVWDFLFESRWKDYQPTFEQFIERVKYAIDMDLEIGDWMYRKASFIKK